jgi:glycosyltransferase involved in cell wall biosynthesis
MSGRLHVALLSHLASSPAPTGAEESLALLAEGLHERGHRVEVVAPGPWVLEERLRGRSIPVHHVAVRSAWIVDPEPGVTAAAAARFLRFALPDAGEAKLASLLRALAPDVVHVNCLPHARGASAARRAGLPFVWHVREILPAGSRRAWFAGRLQDAARIVAVSEAAGGWIRDEGLDAKLTVVPNGVRADGAPQERQAARRALGLPEDGCLVGLFGQVLLHKGPVEFVRAGALALEEEPGLRFVVAGSGPAAMIRLVREEIDGLHNRERFHVLPPQPGSGALHAAADVVCLASTGPDPLPRSVLEAMAAGRPVAAFRSGGVAEMVVHDETGILAEPGDVAGLARAFVLLARDPALRARAGEAGRLRASTEFSLERHVDRMEAVLRSAAAR